VSARPHPRVAAHWPASRHGNLSRYRLLTEIVAEHQSETGESGAELRERDERLYRRFAEIEASLPLLRTREDSARG
jgi:hypothetical protein